AGDFQLETTIRLLANGAGSDVTPDLTFTLAVEDVDADQPLNMWVQKHGASLVSLDENADTSSRMVMARIIVRAKSGHILDEYNH
ncbi:MAG: hypothetical protein ACPG48_08150, partial [Candidatus Puniceispirillaceae bacterium]